MQICTRKDKIWKLYWWRISDSNDDETESDNDNDKYEEYKFFTKQLFYQSS